jgi:uroporphyrinogen-III decarboxylase
MDRARQGWFFDNGEGTSEDDWGCRWLHSDRKNMGQVVYHPLEEWTRLPGFRPPDARNPYYFERLPTVLAEAKDRYVVVTCHFTLMERLHMLHGFSQTLQDFYEEPRKIEHLLDIILAFKLEQLGELSRRFGDRIHGIFLTDDWGSQQNAFVSVEMFRHFFQRRYTELFGAIHGFGWDVILHSCGRINTLVPSLVEAGVDVLNMQQPQTNGLVEFGKAWAGKVAFLTTTDIQKTLPTLDPDAVRAEARELVSRWSTSSGGLIVFNYGAGDSIGVNAEMTEVMFQAFVELKNYWSTGTIHTAEAKRSTSSP